MFTISNTIYFQAIEAYLADSYTNFAVSAIPAANMLRSLAGFEFPFVCVVNVQCFGLWMGR